MRTLDPPLSSLVVLLALLYGLLRQGAYHQEQHEFFALLLVLGATLLLTHSHGRRSLAFGAVVLAPLFASSCISWILSGDRTDARSTFLLVGLVAVGLAGGTANSSTARSTIEGTLVALSVMVGTTAIVGVATHSEPWGRITDDIWRGSSSLTYANAAAAIVAPIALLTFARALEGGNRLHAVACTGLVIALASTQSRGGAVAFVVVALVMAFRFPVAAVARTLLPVLAGVMIGVPLMLHHAEVSSPAHPGRVLVAVALGLAATASLWPMRTAAKRPTLTVGVLGALALLSAATFGRASFFDRLTLRSGTTAEGPDAEVLFGDRADEWAAAWERFAEQPIAGHGPGVVELEWTDAERVFQAMFVHNEYLELLVTHGVIGLLALVGGAVILHRRSVPDVGVTAALATFLGHASLDFLWHVPALPVYFAVLAGTRVDLGIPLSGVFNRVDEGRHAVAGKAVR